MGILYDEYLKDAQAAKPYYEKFLSLSSNEEMRGKVSSWLKEAEEGISLPLRQVEEMPPEARELLEQRTAQYEELRRQLVNRYEGEIAKLREEVAASKEKRDGEPKEENLTASSLDLKKNAAPSEDAAAKELAARESAEEKEKAEADILAAEKKAEEERRAAEKKAEEEKLAAEKKAKAERLAAAEKQKAEEERLKKEKLEREKKIDAFVQTMVREGALTEQSKVISASSLPKSPEDPGTLDLELTEEDKEASTNAVASAASPSPAPAAAAKTSEDASSETKEKAPRYHVVVQGDNLGNISRKYYGEFKRWKDIAEANKDILPDPDKLKIGMKLVIPE